MIPIKNQYIAVMRSLIHGLLINEREAALD